MKKTVCLLLCVIMVCALTACGAKSVVGKWAFGTNTYEFKADGTFVSTFNGLSTNGTYTAEDGKLTLTYEGLLGMSISTDFSYTIEDDTLSLTGDVSLLGSVSMTVTYTKVK